MNNIDALKVREADMLAAIAKGNATAAKWDAVAAKKFAAIENRGARVNTEDRTAEGALEAWEDLSEVVGADKWEDVAWLFYDAYAALKVRDSNREDVTKLEAELNAIRAEIASEEDRKAAIPEALKTLQAAQEKEIAEAMKDARDNARLNLERVKAEYDAAKSALDKVDPCEARGSVWRMHDAYENTKATAGWTDAHIASVAAMVAEALAGPDARFRGICGKAADRGGVILEGGASGMACIKGFMTGVKGYDIVFKALGYDIVCRNVKAKDSDTISRIRVLVLKAK